MLPRAPASLLLPALLAFAAPSAGQEPVRYHIAFPQAAHHEATVTVRFTELEGC